MVEIDRLPLFFAGKAHETGERLECADFGEVLLRSRGLDSMEVGQEVRTLPCMQLGYWMGACTVCLGYSVPLGRMQLLGCCLN